MVLQKRLQIALLDIAFQVFNLVQETLLVAREAMDL